MYFIGYPLYYCFSHSVQLVKGMTCPTQGTSNIVGSFFSCMPITASLSRSLVQETVGGKTQLTSFISCLILLTVMLWIGPFFEPLPRVNIFTNSTARSVDDLMLHIFCFSGTTLSYSNIYYTTFSHFCYFILYTIIIFTMLLELAIVKSYEKYFYRFSCLREDNKIIHYQYFP
jgi:hypothetical protein